MELDNIKLQTTWNDAAGGINSNFAKIRQAILSLQAEGGGFDESQLEEYLSANGYAKEEWVLVKKYLDAVALGEYSSDFITVADGKITLKVDEQGGLGTTEQGLGIVDIPSHLLENITIKVDSELSDTSTNAVQNKVIKAYVDESAKNLDYRIEHLERERVFVFDATCSTDPWELNVLQTPTKIEDVVGAIESNAPIYMRFSEVLVAVSEAYLYTNGDVSLYVYLVDPDSNVARTVHTYATEDSWAWEYYNNTIGGDAGITVDTEMSYESTNPVQNKVVTEYIDKHPQYEVIEEIEVPDLPEGSGGSVDLTGYATEEWVEDKGYATEEWVEDKGYATEEWVEDKGYATEEWVNNQDLASKAWVRDQGYAYALNTNARIAALEERIAAIEKMLAGTDGAAGVYLNPTGVTYTDQTISVGYERVGVMTESVTVRTTAKISGAIPVTKETTAYPDIVGPLTIFTEEELGVVFLSDNEYSVDITVTTTDSNGSTIKTGTFTFTA